MKFQNYPFHEATQKVADILVRKTRTDFSDMYRLMASSYFAQIASTMRVTVKLADDDTFPANMYTINLAPSGSGKGRSMTTMEKLVAPFREVFAEKTIPTQSAVVLNALAQRRANKYGTNPDVELTGLEAEYESSGPMLFSFDSATIPAIKQLRHKLLLSGCGAINLVLDEVGSNLSGSADVFTTFLELFDHGAIKSKLTKSTKENTRLEEINGTTPTNMLCFGTPSKLFDSAKVEEEFISLLETGYARRCFFGMTPANSKARIQGFTSSSQEQEDRDYMYSLETSLKALALPSNVGLQLPLTTEAKDLYAEYATYCEDVSQKFPEYHEAHRGESQHRHFKAIKLAGVYAFIDMKPHIDKEALQQAIALAEQSAEAFIRVMRREKAHVKLAKYICSIGEEVTHADLTESLPFYKGSEAAKRDLMTLACAYGYKHNMIITRSMKDGIEFIKGKTLQATNMDEIVVSYSTDITHGYQNKVGKWSSIDKLATTPGIHWVNHHLVPNAEFPGGYRDEMHVTPGFNLLVLDIDGGTRIEEVQALMGEYTYFGYTTKSHTDTDHCFRLILPMSHSLHLEAADYKAFMRNVYDWLPFDVDTATNQRSRKWNSHAGTTFSNDAALIDIQEFIPKTKKAEENKKKMLAHGNLGKLERWVVTKAEELGRNNTLLRYCLVMVDQGKDFDSIRDSVLSLNAQLPEPLAEDELYGTILTTALKRTQAAHA